MTLDEVLDTWMMPGKAGVQCVAFLEGGGARRRLVSSAPLDTLMARITGCQPELEVYEDLTTVLIDAEWGAGNRDIFGQLPDTIDELLDWVAVVARLHWEQSL